MEIGQAALLFAAGFGGILALLSLWIQWMGQNPAFVLKVPL